MSIVKRCSITAHLSFQLEPLQEVLGMVVELDGCGAQGGAGIIREEQDTGGLGQGIRQEVAQPELAARGPRLQRMAGLALEVEPVDGDKAGVGG